MSLDSLVVFGEIVFAQYPVDGRSGIKPDPTPLSAAIKCRAAFDMPLVECDWILYALFPQVIEHIRERSDICLNRIFRMVKDAIE